jgi:hypothetical protein
MGPLSVAGEENCAVENREKCAGEKVRGVAAVRSLNFPIHLNFPPCLDQRPGVW